MKVACTALFVLGFVVSSVIPAQAQVNQFNTVVVGNKIPLFLDDPTGGMPLRTTTNDFSAFVPRIAGARTLVFSPSGSSFVTASGDDASLWRTDRGTQMLTLQHGGPISWLSFARDGSYIVTAGSSWIRTWSASGEFLKQFNLQANIQKLIVSLDGNYIVAVTDENMQIWNAHQGLVRTKIPMNSRVSSVVISPDVSQIAVLDGTNAVLWRVSDGQMIGTISPPGAVRGVIYSPDSSRLVICTSDWSYLWDPKGFIKIADVQFGGGYK